MLAVAAQIIIVYLQLIMTLDHCRGEKQTVAFLAIAEYLHYLVTHPVASKTTIIVFIYIGKDLGHHQAGRGQG